jgi:hypothetical protein
VNVAVVVTPLVTVALFDCVVCPLFVIVTVYVPTGIHVVAKSPVVPVVPVTVVAIAPPLIVTEAPLTTAPLGETTLAVIFPAVAIAMFSVAVAPLVTLTVALRVRYPLLAAVMLRLPVPTLARV